LKKKNKDLWGKKNKELWDFDYTIAKFILPRLKTFRKVTDSYPSDFKSLKSWKKTLKKMIIAFELTISMIDNHDIEDYKIRQKKIKKGLRLFGKYFEALWL